MRLNEQAILIVRYVSLAVAAWLLVGCSTSQYAPVADLGYSTGALNRAQSAPKSYQVKPGDTMFAIAWRFGWDYKKLAKANGIASPYTIYVGQVVYFNGAQISSSVASKSVIKKPVVRANKATPKPVSAKAATASNTSIEKIYKGPSSVAWNWPLKGKVLRSFSNKNSAFHGIDLSSSLGNSVKAASSGIIVYAGSGIQGYGKLVVVKHNSTFLSAYAYNNSILVKEGDTVDAGEVIAKVGKGPQLDPRLHFEIRKNGKPVNPLGYLPKL